MAYSKGDIVLVDFPFSDNSRSKLRPALVISSDLVHATGDLMLMMITSKERTDGLSLRIEGHDLDRPLPLQSYLRCHKIFVLKSGLIIKKLSGISKNRYNEAVAMLNAIVS